MKNIYGRAIVPVGDASVLGPILYSYKDNIVKVLSQYSEKEIVIGATVMSLIVILGTYNLYKKFYGKNPTL